MLNSRQPRPRHSRALSPGHRRFAALAGDLAGDGFSRIVELINELLAAVIGPNVVLPDGITPESLPDVLYGLTAGLGNSGEAVLSSRVPAGNSIRHRGSQVAPGPNRRDFANQFLKAGYSPEQALKMASEL